MIVRSKDGVEVFPVTCPGSSATADAGAVSSSSLLQGETCSFHTFSHDGSQLLLLRPSVGLVKVDMRRLHESGHLEASLQHSFVADSDKIVLAYFSPRGTFLTTWERPIKVKEGAPPVNLKLWNAQNGSFLRGWFVKAMPQKLDGSISQYSALQFTHDEALCMTIVSNEVHVYDGTSLQGDTKMIMKVRCPNITSFTVPINSTNDNSNNNSYLLTSFVPENKGKPAKVSLHQIQLSMVDHNSSGKESVLIAKSFYQTESITVKWSPKGDAALVQTQTTVDTSGQSYYGSSMLHLFQSTNTLQVTLPSANNNNNTPVVHDVAWCPNPNAPPRFALISGSMPAMATLHNGVTGDAVFVFGQAHRNVISWSPHGRFLCLAGFGNLAGGMDFWDKNKLKKMPRFATTASSSVQEIQGEIRAHCAVGYGWSPDSRSFFVSTTSPRMNVDNGIRLYRYNGHGPYDQGAAVPWDNATYQPNRLLAVEFAPGGRAGVELERTYADRPQSPPPKRVDGVAVTAAAPPTTTSAPSVGRYVPPSARGKGTGGGGGGNSLAERMRREREGSTAHAGKIVMGSQFSAGKKVVPGMAPPVDPNAKSKSAVRRERQKLAKQQRDAEEEAKLAAEQAAAVAAAAAVPVDPEKRAKKIKKMLKQIDDLKKKGASELNDDQKKKLLTEESLRKELESLGL